jgi:Photosynthetic reaction centre cytochrome C subunit
MRTFLTLFIATAVSLVSFALLGQAPPAGKGGPPKNLKVLPANTPNVGALMRVYMASVGASDCYFCHEAAPAGKEADGNPMKAKARMMIQMVMNINKEFGDGKEHVTCYTCHRGAHEPLTVAP